MKVLDLRCANGHTFEGWFASEDDFQEQCARVLIDCPICANNKIQKLPNATRLNSKSNQKTTPQTQPKTASPSLPHSEASHLPPDLMQTLVQKVVEHVVKNTEDVGDGFTEEARRIYYGESPERGIRGRATLEDARELQEEGIDVMPLPLPVASKKDLQ